MAPEIAYLEAEEIVELNLLVLGLVPAKKADKHEVLSRGKLLQAIEKCREAQGGVYDKAAALMRALTAAHAFASGNRRTAFLAAKEFVQRNDGKFAIPDNPDYASIMREIREGKHADEEIAEWIRNGKINKAKR